MISEDMTITKMLESIIKKMGPYKMDPHEHAVSVIEQNSEYAAEILKRLKTQGMIK